MELYVYGYLPWKLIINTPNKKKLQENRDLMVPVTNIYIHVYAHAECMV